MELIQPRIKELKIIEFLPTISWFLFMTLPLIVQFNYFYPPTRAIQTVNILIVFIALLFIDIFFYKKPLNKIPLMDARLLKKIYLLLIISIALILNNLMSLKEIPIFNIFSNQDLYTLRNEATKNIQIPNIYKYLLNGVSNLLLPLLLVIFYKLKRYSIFIPFLLLAIIYSIHSLSKFPIILMLFSFFVLLTFFEKDNFVLKNLKKISIFFLIYISILGIYDFSRKYELPKSINEDLTVRPKILLDHKLNYNSIADDFRFKKIHTYKGSFYSYEDTAYEKIKIYLYYPYYRFFLTPSDVSSRWYQYFSDKKLIYFGDYVKHIDSEKPSRIVSNWAYNSKSPEGYPLTNNANASFDADAYVRFGFFGVIVSLLIIFLFRFVAFKYSNRNIVSKLGYLIFVINLSFFMPSGSIAAIFLAQALLLNICLIILL
jgi:hypothetical protein